MGGAAVGITALAYLVDFVSLLWRPFASARWFSPFGYYDPLTVVDRGIDLTHAAALVVAGTILLLAAVVALNHRDVA